MGRQLNQTRSQSVESMEQQLLQKEQSEEQIEGQKQEGLTLLQRVKAKFRKPADQSDRTITFDGTVKPQNQQRNIVKNTKYNVVTFVPKVLYNQFKFFINMFFLATALSQLIEVLRVGLFITFIGPLVLVLGLTMGKEAYDDYRTHLRDIEANSKKYVVIGKTDQQQVKSKDLKLGDIVKIEGGDRVPADMIILHTNEQQGTLFLKTDQLDGQTDWKLRKAIKTTQNLVSGEGNSEEALKNKDFNVKVKPPSSNIYKFDGLFESPDGKEKLTLQNTMWTSTVLTNGTAIGLVTYVGKQTRIALGASTPRSKVGILDLEINYLSKLLFGILFVITLALVLLQGVQLRYAPIQFVRVLILLSAIIPISMRVNLDFAKLFYAYNINKDNDIPGTIARNSNTPEQLGRIKYILSDKTGTLTRNQMIFRRISIEDNIKFSDENIEEIKQMMADFDQIDQENVSKQKSLKDIMMALILCHNVTPVLEEGKQSKTFQASSPDEITFVKMAQFFGFTLEERTQSLIRIKTPTKKELSFEILNTFPFSSDTKRMGIVLKESETNQIEFYLKGADVVMKELIHNKQKQNFIDEQCKDLSSTGLRTLVISKKKLTEEEYNQWQQQYEKVTQQLEVDPKQVEKVMRKLQTNVEFLGVTGIEDKLQKDLKQVIETLKGAGIKMWMITGDKVETAECISISCGLQKPSEANYKIEDADKPNVWKTKWGEAKNDLKRVLVIDGKTLAMVLNSTDFRKDFFVNAMQMPAVICCRCSPEQKRLLTEGVKQFRNKKQAVLGIGDGGNDVGMIQAADVGVGIQGKQGKQAALAADFSLKQFKSVMVLLLWHGRLSYKRSALLSNFIIHRGFIVSTIQVVFSALFFYVSLPVFNSYLNLGFSTIFTFWPVFSLVLDADISKQVAVDYPRLYESLQNQKKLQPIEFLEWVWKASYQGCVIMVLTVAIFSAESYLLVETVCFSVLILTEYCMTLSQLHRIHILTIFCVLGSVTCYAVCLIFLKNFIELASFTIGRLLYILIITAISFGPLLAGKIIRRLFVPTDYQKVMKHVSRKLVGTKIVGETSFILRQKQMNTSQLNQPMLF